MKALYRKYRPKSLAEVVGQSQVTDSLQKSLENGKINHAYLFTGPRGTGKTSVARIFAHEINHFPYSLEDNYVDIIEIDAASNTGVDNIRDLREKACIAPSQGKFKVYIIDEVHMLSKSAFNALLKTLEEPPAHVIFILATTDIEKVPITITSRVQIYTFKLADRETMHSHLRAVCTAECLQISDDALEIITKRGGGSYRDSLSLLDQISTLSDGKSEITKDQVEKSLGLPQDELIKSLLASYSAKDFASITDNLKSILNSGTKPETLAEELIKTIIDTPSPELLPLLDNLPSVRGVFPEAKLLVAFTKFATPTPVSAPVSAPAVSFASARFTSKPPVSRDLGAPEKVPTFAPPESAPAPVNPAASAKDFNFDGFVDSVKRSSLGAAMWLKKCQHSYNNNSLHLYPATSAVKGILESANNKKVLISCLSGVELIIHEVGENPAGNDPKLSKINDIMGGVMEVNDGGELPF